MINTMQTVDLKNYDQDLSKLFNGFDWTFIPEAIQEGSLGKVLIDDLKDSKSGILTIPEFKINFFGGNPKSPSIQNFIENIPFLTMFMFDSEGWPEVLREIHPEKWIVIPRFGFNPKQLNTDDLRQLQGNLSDEFRIEKIDLNLAKQIIEMAKNKDKLTQEHLFGYSSAEDFMERGLGYCVFEGDKLVSIAAAGASCKKGIEIQVDTRKEYRRRGLATAVAASLIIECLQQDITPNWDAATEESAVLAKKLGYIATGENLVYVYVKFKFLVKLRAYLRKRRGKGIIEP